MRFAGTQALLLGLLAAAPLAQAFPHGTRTDGRDLDNVPASHDAAARDVVFDGDAGEAIKRRAIWDTLDPRGVPRLGSKPGKDTDTPSGSGAGTSAGKAGSREGDDAAENTPGATEKTTVFTNTNFEAARSKGEGLNTELEKTIFNDKEDAGSKVPIVSQSLGYSGKKKPAWPIDTAGGKNYLKEFGIKVSDKSTWVKRWFWKKDNGESSENIPILETVQDTRQGVITVKQSWNKERDPNPKASWTQMVMDNWRRVNKDAGTDVQGLRYMVRDNIQEIKTTDSKGVELNTPVAMREAFSQMDADTSKTLTLNAKSDNAKEAASFQLLSAQTHVARVMQMLKDYHNELGNLQVSKLHLQHMDNPDANQYNIIIEFGK